MNILLIEDNEPDAVLLERSLRMAGLGEDGQVTWVTLLGLGLEKLAECPADVVFLDLGLPDGLGPENVDRVTSAAPQATLIVLTGHDDEETGLDCLRRGAQDFLCKDDLDPDALRRAVLFSRERTKARLSRERGPA